MELSQLQCPLVCEGDCLLTVWQQSCQKQKSGLVLVDLSDLALAALRHLPAGLRQDVCWTTWCSKLTSIFKICNKLSVSQHSRYSCIKSCAQASQLLNSKQTFIRTFPACSSGQDCARLALTLLPTFSGMLRRRSMAAPVLDSCVFLFEAKKNAPVARQLEIT